MGTTRNTDPRKWFNPTFRTLSPKGKLLWGYMTDLCDHGGIWKEDYAAASFMIGIEVQRADLVEFTGKIFRLDHDTLFIPGSIRMQARLKKDQVLNPKNLYHRAIIARLEDFGINPVTLSPSSPLKLIPDPVPDPEPDPEPHARGLEGGSKGDRSPFDGSKGKGKGTGTGSGTGKFLNSQNAEETMQIPARARDEDVSVDVDPAPTQAPELAPLGEPQAPASAPSPASAGCAGFEAPPASNVIQGRFPRSWSAPSPEPVSAPPKAPDPPRAAPASPERRTITPGLPKPITPVAPRAAPERKWFQDPNWSGTQAEPDNPDWHAIKRRLGLRPDPAPERQEVSA